MSWFANVIYGFAGLAYIPVLTYQMIAQRKNRTGWREKLFGPRRSLARSSDRRRVWVHAVSLGEINAARLFVEKLEAADPTLEVVVSTTTDTGFARGCQLFGAHRVFRYPLDFSWAVRNAIRTIDPAAIVLVELEVWFNLTTIAASKGIPVCVINGRLTERSCHRLAMLGPLSRRMFKSLTWVGAQDEPIADRFKSLGSPENRVTVTGSVKWDTAEIADHIGGQDELAAAMGIDTDAPLWVCGSTGPGEEAMLLDAYATLREMLPRLQLALIPRKPERFEEVASLIRQRGYDCVRRSECGGGRGSSVPHPGRVGHPHPSGRAMVFLGDTMGELRKFYSLADVVFVGRSLVPMGGSDPMEVAALAKPIITGPHMSNFNDAVVRLIAANGMMQVESVDVLVQRLATIDGDRAAWQQMGRQAQQVVKANQGATQRTIEHVLELLS
jgi:3-deoxy-D-manno-octulosonic-acid transferase